MLVNVKHNNLKLSDNVNLIKLYLGNCIELDQVKQGNEIEIQFLKKAIADHLTIKFRIPSSNQVRISAKRI